MQVKVFEAEDMASGLKMIKETLGPDALILSTRMVRKKGFLFGKPCLEITAALDTPDDPLEEATAAVKDPVTLSSAWEPPPETPPPAEPPPASSAPSASPELEDRLLPLEQELVNLRRQVADRREVLDLKRELGELKGLLQDVSGKAAPRAETLELGTVERLRKCGIEADVAHVIVGNAGRRHPTSWVEDPAEFEVLVKEAAAALVRVTGTLKPGARRPLKVALVGPTGVGKTTTVAKLAAEYMLRTRGKVALITIDTYRIAAAEQLRIYGEIMRVPVEVVLHLDQMRRAFAKHADKDLILIDTAGRSPRDDTHINELSGFMATADDVESHLVVAAHTRPAEMEENIRSFGRIPLSSFIFTKLDECDNYGALLNLPIRHGLPVSFITNGQRVPEDLLIAAPENIADYILRTAGA